MKLSKKEIALIIVVVALAIGNLAFAILYTTRDVDITGGISTMGSIEVYQEDGTAPLTNINYANFTPGVSGYRVTTFYINNTGNQPVYVYWNISTSSISWYKLDMDYRHDESGTLKYHCSIYNATDYWIPDTEARVIPVGQRIREDFWLYYTGDPTTAETFSFTVTFYARDA